MREELQAEWTSLYKETLPEFAKDQNWPVWNDHCIARIVYDHVAEAKWDTLWDKPAIRKMPDEALMACISTAKKEVNIHYLLLTDLLHYYSHYITYYKNQVHHFL